MATSDITARYGEQNSMGGQAWFGAARRFMAWRAKRARRGALHELLEFDEHQLRDIGLTRADVRRAIGR